MHFASHLSPKKYRPQKLHWFAALALSGIFGCGVTAVNNGGPGGPGGPGDGEDGDELTEEEQAQQDVFETSFELDDGSNVEVCEGAV